MEQVIFLSFSMLLGAISWVGSGSSSMEEEQNTGGWNISYTVPEKWSLQRAEGRLRVFVDQATRSALFIAPSYNQTAQGMANDVAGLAGMLNLKAQVTEGLKETTIQGRKAITGSADFVNNDTHENLKGYGITVFGQHKTSLGILVLAKPENYEMARKALENIVSTIQIGKPTENRGVVAELAGTWVYYSGGSSPNIARSGSWSHSYQETVHFDGVGNYRWKSSSHVAASSHQWGDSQTSASNIGANNSMGTYTVIDNTLITTNEHGTFTYDFQLYGKKLVSGGRTFLKE